MLESYMEICKHGPVPDHAEQQGDLVQGLQGLDDGSAENRHFRSALTSDMMRACNVTILQTSRTVGCCLKTPLLRLLRCLAPLWSLGRCLSGCVQPGAPHSHLGTWVTLQPWKMSRAYADTTAQPLRHAWDAQIWPRIVADLLACARMG